MTIMIVLKNRREMKSMMILAMIILTPIMRRLGICMHKYAGIYICIFICIYRLESLLSFRTSA